MNLNGNPSKTCLFESEVWLPHPRNKVLDFFKQAENLQFLTPEWLNFKILTPLPISMKEGTLIDYSLRLYGISFHWQTKIAKWMPPIRFVDIQVKGPYQIWEHTHSFEEINGGTLMRDQVRYRTRGGFLAPVVNTLFVTRSIVKIFEYRRNQILKIFA